MATPDTFPETFLEILKPRKDKSSKKRKVDDLAGSVASTITILRNAAASEPTELTKLPHKKSSVSDEKASYKSKKASAMKNEGLGKKRKSSYLDDPIRDVSESATSFQVPDEACSPSFDNDDAQGPSGRKRKDSVGEIEVDVNAPEPPSKKALRHLKKGKPLPPSKSGADSTPEPELKREKKNEVEKRSEYGVWIGNLSWSVSKDDLRTFLMEHAGISAEMITRVHMPGPNDSKPANKVEKKFGKVVHNKGFAYVDFSVADAVEKAVQLSEQLMSGRRLLIKNQKSFEGRPEKTKEESRNEGKPPSKKIFLGNLSFDVTGDMIKDHFEKCGEIESVKIATFEDTGKCKGYAWITFEELEAAKNAVRGFVHIEEDLSDTSQSEDETSEEQEEASKPRKTRTRKWWVNKIKGRPLRMEFAEGADVRYKKRYGKEGTKNANAGDPEMAGQEVREEPARSAPEYRPSERVTYDRPYGAPRLTGGIVRSEGRKITF